jgi:hemolysin activation/secretion protein
MLFGGVDMRYSDSQESASSILGQTQPYGTGSFGSLGLRAGLELDSRGKPAPYNIWDMGTATSARDIAGQKASGVRLTADGVYRPAVWDVQSGYGQVSGALSGYVGSSRVVLAARVGGQRVFGEYPWFDAAFLGGLNARGYTFQRFAGDTAFYGGAELRLWAARVRVLPLRLGFFGFYETGRVWLSGASDGEWHDSYGGGLLMQLPSTPITVRARIAHSNESTLFYFGSGFSF